MAWRFWRRARRRRRPADLPRRNWTRLPVLDTTIGNAATILTHTDLFGAGTPDRTPDSHIGAIGHVSGIVLPQPDPEPPWPETATAEGPPQPVRALPVVPQHTETAVPLTRASATTVGEPHEPSAPFRSITDFDRLMAQYEGLDAGGIAAAIGISSIADPPPVAQPVPDERGRSLRRPTLAQSRRLGLTAKSWAAMAGANDTPIVSPQETEQEAPPRPQRTPGEPVYSATPWSTAAMEHPVPVRALWTSATIASSAPPQPVLSQPEGFAPPSAAPPPAEPAWVPPEPPPPALHDEPAMADSAAVQGSDSPFPVGTDSPPVVGAGSTAPDPPLPAGSGLRRQVDELSAAVRTLTARPEPPDLADPETVTELAGRLYRHIHSRLRAELLIDRERHGTLADHW